ncbi:MAG TPA: hypothetical protein VFR85_16855 [Anaeromyxobacteraceae bacterium]|nr:hypothetical protein [Anaeromyxobacteraceae bacterium]
MTRYQGRCHCGNLEVAFETAQAPGAIQLRACGCTFCRRHGAVAVTDPGGQLEVRLRRPAEVSRYRFGLRTADFLLCQACGVYVAAVCDIDGALYATLNANVLEARQAFTQEPVPVSYDREDAGQRLARRRRAWTPARVNEGAPP